ncbi:MAG: restriction endonuclease subunit S [Oscillospiraceae bacterium]|nr:restriction endonuclease subunit S [Oscillospiraceae bacterium]
MNKVKLIDICDDLSDGLHAAPVFNPQGEYLFVNAINLENGYIIDTGDGKRADYSEYVKYRIDLNDRTILYSIDGTIGKIARYRGEKVILGKGACYIKLKETVNADYIYYLLQSSIFQAYLKSMTTGSTIHHISLETMRNFSFALPDRVIQDCIAKVLLVIDQKIDLNTRICTELESMARTLYDYWFVQFDFPDENGKPYRSSGGEMMWCQELGREVPKGWKLGTIGDLGEVVSGATPSTTEDSYYTDSGIAWITPNDLSNNGQNMFIAHGERDITEAGLQSCSSVLMPEGSVLMSSRAPIGYLAIAANDACTNQGFKSIICNKGFLSLYVYYTLKRNVDGIARQGVGTTFKEVSREALTRYPVLLPPQCIAERFEYLLQPVGKARLKCEQEASELVHLRDWLLPMPMNGQAKVVL